MLEAAKLFRDSERSPHKDARCMGNGSGTGGRVYLGPKNLKTESSFTTETRARSRCSCKSFFLSLRQLYMFLVKKFLTARAF